MEEWKVEGLREEKEAEKGSAVPQLALIYSFHFIPMGLVVLCFLFLAFVRSL